MKKIICFIALVLSSYSFACSQSQDQLIVDDLFNSNMIICSKAEPNERIAFQFQASQKTRLGFYDVDFLCSSGKRSSPKAYWDTYENGEIVESVLIDFSNEDFFFTAYEGLHQEMRIEPSDVVEACGDFYYFSFKVETISQ